MEQPDNFLLGVNYWPRRKAMYWWKAFDGREVGEEFADIASMGFTVVRCCLLWEDFQPAPDQVSERALGDLVATLDAAQRHGLRVMPTLIVGNMSGVMWFPPWAMSDRVAGHPNPQVVAGRFDRRVPRDLYAEPGMLRAQARLAQAVARRCRDHPALFGWDLANEIDAALAPASDDAGWLWLRTLAQALRREDPAHPITYGAHPPSLDRRNGLSVVDMGQELDFLSMHGYPIYSEHAAGPLDPEFVPFVTWLTAQLGGKPALMQEFGLPTVPPGQPSRVIEDDFLGERRPQFMASEEDAAAYYAAVLERLVARGALGAFAWCYADYSPDLWQRPPLDRAVRERSFGLVRADGSHKPAVAVIQQFAARLRASAIDRPTAATAATREREGALTARLAHYYDDPGAHFSALYADYRRLHAPWPTPLPGPEALR